MSLMWAVVAGALLIVLAIIGTVSFFVWIAHKWRG